MRKLRIGILGTRGIPNHYGGFEQFASYLSVGLSQRGHEVSVYNSSQHPYQDSEWNGVRIIHCTDPESRLGTFGQFVYDLHCINDARRRDFDVLLHLGYTSDSVWYWRWPKQSVNLVNIDGMEWMRSKYNKPTRRFLKLAESLAAKHAGVLIADSPQMQHHFWTSYGKKPVYIPYGADVFTATDHSVPASYDLEPNQYHMLVARMEPENNIEMILRGYLESSRALPLLVIGNMANKYGRFLKATYQQEEIRYAEAIYDQRILNNLRFFSARYFHGHSVGGTNPSLLEAMACRCDIAAHNNVFNRAVLEDGAEYFSSEHEVSRIIEETGIHAAANERKNINLEKIRTVYSIEKNVLDYERLMLQAVQERKVLIRTSTVKAA